MAGGHAGSRRHAHRGGRHAGHGVVHVAAVVAVLRWRRGTLLVQSAKFVLLRLEVIVGECADFAVGTGLVGAAMSVGVGKVRC